MAIDQAENKKGYNLTLEIVDVTKSRKENIETAIIESTGSTLLEAIREAKKRTSNRLYFADIAIIIISEQIAREEDVTGFVDWYLRDTEHRETLSFVVSKEKTAKEIIATENPTNSIIAYAIKEIVTEDQTLTASVTHNEAYKIYNTLQEEKQTIILPAFHIANNDNEAVAEATGLAIFNKDGKLVGFIDDSKSKYVLFATNKIKGGFLSINKEDDSKNTVSLEITNSTTKTSFTYKENKLKFILDIKTSVILNEYRSDQNKISSKEITKLKKLAEKKINKEVKEIIKYVQSEYNSDIFGFSNIIYKKNPKLWKNLSKDWNNIFKEIEIEVNSNVKIINTSFIK